MTPSIAPATRVGKLGHSPIAQVRDEMTDEEKVDLAMESAYIRVVKEQKEQLIRDSYDNLRNMGLVPPVALWTSTQRIAFLDLCEREIDSLDPRDNPVQWVLDHWNRATREPDKPQEGSSIETEPNKIANNKAEDFLVSHGLTKREVEVAKWLNDGYTNKEISEKLVISLNTVKEHVGSIRQKLKSSLQKNEDTKQIVQRLLDDLGG